MAASRLRGTLVLAYAIALAVVAYFAITGSSYYLTPLVERPRHEAYWALKPGGAIGHALGTVGSVLMVLMLLYTLRKRVRAFQALGALRLWLHFHIFCGIIGPLLVILHSSFKVHGLVALSFWSMIVVSLSGFVGRFLYVQLPRQRSGDELSLVEAEALDQSLRARLESEFQLSQEQLEALDRISSSGLEPGASLLKVFLRLPIDPFVLRVRLRRLQGGFSSTPRGVVGDLSRVLYRKAYLHRRIFVLRQLQRLFYYWHIFHKPFSVIMYLFMVVHVAVALATGYGWGFGT